MCGCLDHLPHQEQIGPQVLPQTQFLKKKQHQLHNFFTNAAMKVFCNLTCEGQPCGGHQGGEEYFSLYCRHGEGLAGVEIPEAWIQESPQLTVDEPESDVTMAMLLQEVNGLNSIAVVIACLLCIIIVFVMLILVYIYFKRQDKKLFKANKKTLETLNSKLFNAEETTYGSHNLAYENEEEEDDEVFHNGGPEVVKKGKSKFYNLETGNPVSESREGKSKFYRQSGVDIKTPSPAEDEEGTFKNIFAGSKSDEDDEDERDHPK